MNRFSVIYLYQKQFHQLSCDTQTEAEALLVQLSSQQGRTPLGVYDAKTELFDWEPARQDYYDQAPIEEQGKHGHQIIAIAKQLRQQGAEHSLPENSISQQLSTNEV